MAGGWQRQMPACSLRCGCSPCAEGSTHLPRAGRVGCPLQWAELFYGWEASSVSLWGQKELRDGSWTPLIPWEASMAARELLCCLIFSYYTLYCNL